MTPARQSVYLDNAATTPMRPEALAAMLPFLGEQFGNPTGSHAMARAARDAIEDARDVMADALACDRGEVVFTGGGTEANNLAIVGVATGRRMCSAVEHHAVLRPVTHLGGAMVRVDSDGVIDLGALDAALDDSVSLVSVMTANNETGVVQPVEAVASVVRSRAPGALVHTDAIAAFSWVAPSAYAAADLVSVSAHKFGGPKGVGALVVRDGVKVAPILRGGGQERERRSGTHNVAAIVAMAAAAEVTVRERATTVARIAAMRDRLAAAVTAARDVVVSAGTAQRTAATLHVQVSGVESEALLIALDELGVCASAGSSCASGALEKSHVLEAMGVAPELAGGALRLSLGWATTEADIAQAIVAVPKAIEGMRARA